MAARVKDRADDPSVIVGLACRVPGASTPSKLWDSIAEQRDVQQKMPKDRFNVDAFYHPEPTHKATVSAGRGQKSRRRQLEKAISDNGLRPMPALATF